MPTEIIVQLLGLFILVAGISVGYMRFIRPRADTLNIEARGLLLLLLLTMMGGFIGSSGWWIDAPQAFAWDLPALASRMLGAAAVAFGWLNYAVLQKPSQERIRLALFMLAIYLTPLALAIILFHRDRFDPSAPITYAFFILVIGMIIANGWYLLRQPTIMPSLDDEPPTLWISRWLGLIAGLLSLWGLALFISDSGPEAIWVWPGDLLTSRLIAVMLLALAVGALYSLRSADVARLMLSVIVVYGVGVVIANLINLAGGKPIKPVYLIAFGLLALISGFLARRPAHFP